MNNNITQLQFLLNELNNYVIKVNDIITQMYNVLNQLNNPIPNQFNNQMNNMENFMNMMNMNQMNFNLNMNNNNLNLEDKNEQITYCNILFNNSNTRTLISMDINKTINELLNEYLKRINKIDLIDNYDNKFSFIYNANKLNDNKDSKIKNFFDKLAEIYVVQLK